MMVLPIFSFCFFFLAEIFERIGARERRVLWDLFGAVQCELGITSRYAAAACLPACSLSHSHCFLPCFCFWTLHWIKATVAAGRRPGQRHHIALASFDCFPTFALADCGGNEE